MDRMNELPFHLNDEVALITGGATGLGFGMASGFVAAGARVVLVARREHKLREAVKSLGEKAAYEVQDITKLDQASDLIERANGHFGDISILVNNAGVHLKKPVTDTSPKDFRKVMETHVDAAVALVRAAVPGMQRKAHGNILFTASMTAFIGMPDVAAYTAAKSAYTGLVRGLATELAPDGIRVNGIAPGWIASEMLEEALQDAPECRQKILDRTPMHRFGDPEDIGWTATFLCSPAAKFITGTVIPVDGGALIGF